MGTSQADKAASHERIIDAAATTIRRDGVAGLNLSSLMTDAGLTHGGFYRHFASRDALITEAVEAALERSSSAYRTPAAPDPPKKTRSLGEIIDEYLNPEHRDDPGSGCAIAALANDVARGSEDARRAYTKHVRRYIKGLSIALPDNADRAGDDPYMMLAAMVGALVLARAVDDPTLSNELLSHTAHGLRRIARAGRVSPPGRRRPQLSPRSR